MDLAIVQYLLIPVLKIAAVLGFVLTVAGLLTWAERRQSAMMQDRVGPTRAGIFGFKLFGLLHPLADVIKSITKEDFVPAQGDRLMHRLAPVIALVPVLATVAVIPFGSALSIGGHRIALQIAEVNVGILFIFAVSAVGVYGISLAGWSSNNKFGLLGGLRATAQMISYEVTLGLTIMGVVMYFGTLQLNQLVERQGGLLMGWLPAWGIFVQPLAFFLFLAAAVAETKRAPFDLPEAESELVAGYFTEYSGMRFGMFYLGEFSEVVVLSVVMTALFLGGYHLPYLYANGFQFPWGGGLALNHNVVVLLQVFTMVVKIVALCFLQLALRWTVPRFRYDQVMRLGWKIILPLSLANIVLTGIVIQFL